MSQADDADLPPSQPQEQPIRARVPDHVAMGAFSTGVILMTAQAEFILDFVQNLGRPHQIVARVVMPHHVLPQFIDALQRNIELYRNRWGDLPSPLANNADESHQQLAPADDATAHVGGNEPAQVANQASSGGNTPSARQASAQDIYDDLKIRDEILSGTYANAVMIGHGPHEFSFDFITNFFPHSAVSARVFLAAGQMSRLLESLNGTWEQLRNRRQPPQDPNPGFEPPTA